eukprot:SAG22_NODE_10946_length_508_cov_0.990220_1_plen_24_part_01
MITAYKREDRCLTMFPHRAMPGVR